ncbi:ISPsy5, transposase [gamma proteobacterium NOR5-3]|nr:ISPsy5, transposase [gamma proteobacterium NOR5-3]
MALGHIRQLYRIEQEIADRSPEEKYRARQALSVPKLMEFKAWLTKNQSHVVTGSLTRKAIDYALNQWEFLIGYCDDGELCISNALAENAIRPFAVGRKAWLFADTTRGAHASATMYSLIETAKANHLEPRSYLLHVLERIGAADTVEKIEALLAWNADLPRFEKTVKSTFNSIRNY